MKGRNVLGGELQACSVDPLTGFFRDGFCRSDGNDSGLHCVCSVVSKEFLEFSKERGNDLSTPRPEYRFPGLKPGDCWCLCISRWKEALDAGCAPPVVLRATNEATLEFIDLEDLKKHAAVV